MERPVVDDAANHEENLPIWADGPTDPGDRLMPRPSRRAKAMGGCPRGPLAGAVIGILRMHGGCRRNKKAAPTRVFPLVKAAFADGSPDWTRTRARIVSDSALKAAMAAPLLVPHRVPDMGDCRAAPKTWLARVLSRVSAGIGSNRVPLNLDPPTRIRG